VIGPEIEEASKLRGLSSLALANAIQIKVDNSENCIMAKKPKKVSQLD